MALPTCNVDVAARRRVWVAASLLAMVTAGTFLSGLDGAFVLDDTPRIVRNEEIKTPWDIEAVRRALESEDYANRPVPFYTIALSYALGGLNPVGYRLLNILVHVIAALALMGVVRRTIANHLEVSWLRPRATGLAFTAAVLWAVHPIQTQSVTYICQRFESMMGMFVLLGFYCFIRSLDAHRPNAWRVASTAWLILAIASKETAVFAPWLLLLWDRTFTSGGFISTLRRRRVFYGVVLMLSLGAIAWLATHGRPDREAMSREMSRLDYLLSQGWVFMQYLRQSVFPTDVYFDFGDKYVARYLTLGHQLAGWVAMGAFVVLTGILVWRRSPWGFLAAWFVVLHIPTAGAVVISTEIGANQRMYLPLAALLTGLAIGAVRGWDRLLLVQQKRGRSLSPRLPVLVTALIVAALIGCTVRHNRRFTSQYRIWKASALQVPKNPRAWQNLGAASSERGEHKKANLFLRRSLQDHPDRPESRLYFARLALKQQLFDLAHLMAAPVVRSHPQNQQGRFYNGVALSAMGYPHLAIDDLTAAIAIEPSDARPHHARAVAYYAIGEYDKALADAEQARQRGLDFHWPPDRATTTENDGAGHDDLPADD
jgi:4-amino-4-deoxy-L-arabinose transferase-like glycosyltransferase